MIDEIFPEPSEETQEALNIAYAEFNENQVLSLETIERLSKLESKAISETLTSYGLWYQNAEAKARAKRAELEPIIEKLKSEIQFLDDKVDFIKWRIRALLEPSMTNSLTNQSVDMFYTKSETVEITNPESVPVEYCEVKTYPVKKLIKQALESGEDLDFAHIQTHYNLQVKPGGERAIANAQKRANERAKKEQPIDTEELL